MRATAEEVRDRGEAPAPGLRPCDPAIRVTPEAMAPLVLVAHVRRRGRVDFLPVVRRDLPIAVGRQEDTTRAI